MPENYYHTLLGLEKEVLAPDYYQLLMLDSEAEITADQIEEGYKAQMKKAQQVSSTKYKDLVEFLKGELRNARRTLLNDKLRDTYDKERKVEARHKVREVITTMIQISGNLSEIEIGEIHRRAHIANYPRRDAEAQIDELLAHFNCKRVKATAAQMSRAGEIMRLRAISDEHMAVSPNLRAAADAAIPTASASGSASDSAANIAVIPEAKVGSSAKTSGANDAAKLAADAEKLMRQAERRKKYGPLFKILAGVNLLLAGVAWLVLLAALVYAVAGSALQSVTASALGDGGLLLLHGQNPPLDAAKQQIATLTTQTGDLTADVAKLKADLHEATRDRTKKETVQAIFGTGDVSAATKATDELLASGQTDAEAVELYDFYRQTIAPAAWSQQPRWRWDFAGQSLPLDFRHEQFAHAAGNGMDVIVPADAPPVTWDFGGPFKAGIVAIKGEWLDGNQGAVHLSALVGNTADPAIVAHLIANPTSRALDLKITHAGNGTTIGGSEHRDLPGTASANEFAMHLQILKQEKFNEPETLISRAVGFYRQAGFGEINRVSKNLEIESNGQKVPVVGGQGRLRLTFPPGTKIRLTEITVR